MLALNRLCLPSTSRQQFTNLFRSLFVRVQETPNPLSLKFLPGCPVLEGGGMMDFPDFRSASKSLLAKELFRIEGVNRVFYGKDFITVSKLDEEIDWGVLKPQIFAAIAEFFQTGAPILSDEPVSPDTEIHDDDSETVILIKELLDTKVRPTVQEDGGDVVFMGYEENVLKLKLVGACTGCPSATVTLKAGIENMVKFYVPEVESVEQVMDEADRVSQAEFEKLEEKIRVREKRED